MLEVVTEQMFTDPSILDTIASALRQNEGSGGSAPPAVPEPAEGVHRESTAGTESVMIVPPPTSTGEDMGASLPQPAEAATAALGPSVAGVAEGVVVGAGPSSPQRVATVAEEVLVPSQLLTVQNRAQVHRKPTGDLVPFSPRRVLPRFVNPRIGSKLLGFSI
jgi:hypothetical protein